MQKKFICLSNSRKISGRCIAGKEYEGGTWIRPISPRLTEEISEEERRYQDGTMPEVLDIITLEAKDHKPNNIQKENYLIDPEYYWLKSGTFPKSKLDSLCDTPHFLWKDYASSYQGKNDRIHKLLIIDNEHSLYFIKINMSTIIVRKEGAEFGNGKRKVRIKFSYAGIEHILPITDPKIESEYLRKTDGSYVINFKHYLCLSIGMPYNDDNCYIFAATVLK